jgi:hypothetical protein
MNQTIAKKLEEFGNDKTALMALMSELDEEKRRLRDALRKYSNEAYGQSGLAGRERFGKIRRMKAKLGFLVEEREALRKKLGQLNGDQKALKRAMNTKSPQFKDAFLAAAERMLSDEQLLALELKAVEILDNG